MVSMARTVPTPSLMKGEGYFGDGLDLFSTPFGPIVCSTRAGFAGACPPALPFFAPPLLCCGGGMKQARTRPPGPPFAHRRARVGVRSLGRLAAGLTCVFVAG